ncbi:MAG: 50S ribosomal protein L24 [Cytophagales bacterium]|nr:MAG: 50S ribosomal protein L24 [Cytophagales bacterium]
MKTNISNKVKFSLRRGDKVIVTSGDSKGKTGVITSINVEEHKAIVEGLNMVSRHVKPTSQKPNGSIVKKEAPIHISNLQILDSKGKPSRISKKLSKDGKYVRIAKTTGEEIKNG